MQAVFRYLKALDVVHGRQALWKIENRGGEDEKVPDKEAMQLDQDAFIAIQISLGMAPMHIAEDLLNQTEATSHELWTRLSNHYQKKNWTIALTTYLTIHEKRSKDCQSVAAYIEYLNK